MRWFTMKRVVVVIAVVVVAMLAGVLTGCDFLLPATPQEQVQGFLAAASAETQDPYAMRAFFDPNVADYPNMYDPEYWDARFFNDLQEPYGILGASDGLEDPDYPGSVTVTGHVTNSVNEDPGYPAEFVLIADPDDLFADPLIRKITVTVTDPPEVIEKVMP